MSAVAEIEGDAGSRLGYLLRKGSRGPARQNEMRR